MQTGTDDVAERYSFGPFEVRTATREVLRDGQPIKATPLVFDLLVLLLARRQRVVRHAELLRMLWPRRVVSRGALTQTMLSLRKALGGDEDADRWILSVRGVGYRFVGPVSATDRPDAVSAGGEHLAPIIARPSSEADVAAHRVDVLRRGAWERWARVDTEGLKHVIEALRDRQTCGLDPRARVLALAYGSTLRSGENDMVGAWQMQEEAMRLAEPLASPEVRCDLLRVRASFLIRFAIPGEAVPPLSEAFRVAEGMVDPTDAADIASMLVASFGRTGDAASCEEWTDRALGLLRQSVAPWFRARCLAMLAGTWVHLGELAMEEKDASRARAGWGRSLQLLDEADAADGPPEAMGTAAVLLPINRAWAEGYADPARRPASIAAFRHVLDTQTDTVIRLSALLGVATFLRDEGALDDARAACDEALALGDSTRIMRGRAGLLDVAADVATRQGRHGDAVRHLRALIDWREATARADALRNAKVAAMRLKTDRAMAAARAADELARRAQADRDDLRRQQRLAQIEGQVAAMGGPMTMAQFGAWLGMALARAAETGQPPALLLLCRPGMGRGASPAPGHEGSDTSELLASLRAVARATDRWAAIDEGLVLLALDGVTPDLQQAIAARLRQAVDSRLGGSAVAGTPPGVQVRSLDLQGVDDVDTVWRRARDAAGCLRGAAQAVTR